MATWARWWSEGNWFTVFSVSDEGYRKGNWYLSGIFDDKTIRGIERIDNHVLSWEGKRVDGKLYELPLKPEKAVVIVKLLNYVGWPSTCDDVEKHLNQGYPLENILPMKQPDEDRIGGFIFQILCPNSHKGKLITSHHDGIPASGLATRIAKEGQLYIQIVDKEHIGDHSFGICSIDLNLEETKHQDVNDYRLELLSLLRDSDEQKRFMAIRRLGNLNDAGARRALSKAYFTGGDDVRNRAAYMLAYFPDGDAEAVYIGILEGNDNWMKWHAIRALSEIGSTKSVSRILDVQKNTSNWSLYYCCVNALRKIRSEELPQVLEDALSCLRTAKCVQALNTDWINDEKLVHSASLLERDIGQVALDLIDIYLSVPYIKDYEPEHKYNTLTILSTAKGVLPQYVSRGLRDDDIYIRHKFHQLVKALHLEHRYKEETEYLEKSDHDLSRFEFFAQPHENDLDLETILRPRLPAEPVIKQHVAALANGILGYPPGTRLFIEGRRAALENNPEDILFEISKIDGIRQAKPVQVVLENVETFPDDVTYAFEGSETDSWTSVKGLHVDKSPVAYGNWTPFSPMKKVFRIQSVKHHLALIALFKDVENETEEYLCYADIDNNGKADTRFGPNGKMAILLDGSWHDVNQEGNTLHILIGDEIKEIVIEGLGWEAK